MTTKLYSITDDPSEEIPSGHERISLVQDSATDSVLLRVLADVGDPGDRLPRRGRVMPTKPKPNRAKPATSVTLDAATRARLERIRDRNAGIESISAAIRHAAQFTDDREARAESKS